MCVKMVANSEFKGSIYKLEGPEPTNEQKVAYKKWQKDDAKEASLITSALSKPIAKVMWTCNNADEIWRKLRARFECSSV